MTTPQYAELPAENVPQHSGSMDAGEMLGYIFSNKHMERLCKVGIFPEAVYASFDALLGNSTKLSFLDDEELLYLMQQWRKIRLRSLTTIQKGAVQSEALIILDTVEAEYYINLRKSRGRPSGQNAFELISNNTDVRIEGRPNGNTQADNIGFFGRLLGKKMPQQVNP